MGVCGCINRQVGGCPVCNQQPAFPTTARIGYRDYVIERWESRVANERGNWGEHSSQLGIIRVDEALIDRDPVKAGNTLLHELIHACWTSADLADDDKEERIVTCLANQLTQLWRDNPSIVAWLNHTIGEIRE